MTDLSAPESSDSFAAEVVTPLDPNHDLQLILAHLSRIDLLVRHEVIRLRQLLGTRADEEYRGLYVSQADVDALLDPTLPPVHLLQPPPLSAELKAPMVAAMQALELRIQRLEHDRPSRLSRLMEVFGLSPLERDILLLSLASEVDPKYEQLFAYLQDDVTRKRPTVHLVLRLLCPQLLWQAEVRAAFEPSSPLLFWELLSLNDEPGGRKVGMLSRYLKVDERITSWLLGAETPDARLTLVRVMDDESDPVDAEDTAILSQEVMDRICSWTAEWRDNGMGRGPVIQMYGRFGSGRRAASRLLARELGMPLLTFDCNMLAKSDLRLTQALKLAEREGLLWNGVVCWANADAIISGKQDNMVEELSRFLQRGRAPTVLLTEKYWEVDHSLGRRVMLKLELPHTDYNTRRSLWESGLRECGMTLSAHDLNALSARFQLTGGQVREALKRARALAWMRSPATPVFTLEELDSACRQQAQHQLSILAKKLPARYGWNDIVLPRQPLASLKLICAMLRTRGIVYDDWGFDRKLSRGKGILALFAGPSGTGKTMSAEVIARDLGLELYRIDLSSVVSKFIGETEKNLERLFTEAEQSDAILFFDEADALFGKRSEVKDAHDRYANQEISYLLQRTEEYRGLVILASNLKKNMDDAFVRRLHFVIEFPMPEEAERLEIWRRTLPPEAPRDENLDLPFLARKFRFAGGSIRNVVLTSAFLAAEEETPIGMRHLMRATAHELQKMGKFVVQGDFENYYELVKY